MRRLTALALADRQFVLGFNQQRKHCFQFGQALGVGHPAGTGLVGLLTERREFGGDVGPVVGQPGQAVAGAVELVDALLMLGRQLIDAFLMLGDETLLGGAEFFQLRTGLLNLGSGGFGGHPGLGGRGRGSGGRFDRFSESCSRGPARSRAGPPTRSSEPVAGASDDDEFRMRECQIECRGPVAFNDHRIAEQCVEHFRHTGIVGSHMRPDRLAAARVLTRR